MNESVVDRPDEVPIATSTRVPREPIPEESDDETDCDPDEAPIATRTRVA